jgi:hypothetical protein
MDNPEHQKEFLKQIQDAIVAKMNELAAFENSEPNTFGNTYGNNNPNGLRDNMRELESTGEILF